MLLKVATETATHGRISGVPECNLMFSFVLFSSQAVSHWFFIIPCYTQKLQTSSRASRGDAVAT